MCFSQVLTRHFALYPKMRPADAVKLAYQNALAGGHLIKDSESSLAALYAELAATPTNSARPLAVGIGNGLSRVDLAVISEYRITPEALNDAFVRSAETVRGSISALEERLLELSDFVRAESPPAFTYTELKEYISDYSDKGYPMLSHSAEYRAAYAPAYRVILSSLLSDISDTDSF